MLIFPFASLESNHKSLGNQVALGSSKSNDEEDEDNNDNNQEGGERKTRKPVKIKISLYKTVPKSVVIMSDGQSEKMKSISPFLSSLYL